MGLLSKEKKQELIEKIKQILEEHPLITIEEIESKYNNDFGIRVMMLLGENGYFIRDPYPYKSWGSIPLSEVLKSLK